MPLPDYTSALLDSALPHKEALAGLVRPALLALAPDAEGCDTLGVSYLGGTPDAPPEFTWPTHQGSPLAFIAQIDLAELPDFPARARLPAGGRLWFFYEAWSLPDDPEPGTAVVLYSDTPTEDLEPAEVPDELDQRYAYDPLRLYFEVINTVPDCDHPSLYRLGLSEEQTYDYAAVIADVNRFRDNVPRLGHNQVLGYPEPVQTTPCSAAEARFGEQVELYQLSPEEIEEARRAQDARAEEWELLLQVDTQPDWRGKANGMKWGNSGRLYFLIRRADLME